MNQDVSFMMDSILKKIHKNNSKKIVKKKNVTEIQPDWVMSNRVSAPPKLSNLQVSFPIFHYSHLSLLSTLIYSAAASTSFLISVLYL